MRRDRGLGILWRKTGGLGAGIRRRAIGLRKQTAWTRLTYRSCGAQCSPLPKILREPAL
jgi:hypothetical protein